MTDVTLVVAAHDETAVSGPTMRSADLAAEAARAAGLSVEPVIALDAANEATTAYFAQSCFDHWQRREYDEGDRGRVRGALVPECEGRHIAFLDAGDLVSENWLADGVTTLDEAGARGERVVAHPELTVVFDGARSVQVGIAQDSRLFTPRLLPLQDYYAAFCLAPREAHRQVRYASREVVDGSAEQGRRWTIETMEAGWRHLVVPDTIGFERRRELAPATEDTARRPIPRALPALAIDRVRALGRRRAAG